MAVFQYSPLDLDRPALRLVRLRAARAGPGIDCEFIEAFFDEDYVPDYEAISYTWGSLRTPAEIQLNGSRFAVTENLRAVLQDVRYPDVDRILWVDAICIDQGSHSELGHQVQQMDQIYRRAQRVVIWLGPLTDPTSLLMDTLADLHRQLPGIGWPPSDPRWQISRDRLRDGSPQGLAALAQVFIDILERPWFRRVWIIQEVANARAALVQCGPKSVTARVFAACPNLLDVQAALENEFGQRRYAYDHCQAILDVMPGPSRRESWWHQRRDLRTFLKKFSQTEATREHDRVFALLGLCPEAKTDIPVDYTQSIGELSRKVLSHILPCDPRYLVHIDYVTVGELVRNFEVLHYEVLESLLRMSEPRIVDAFVDKYRQHLTFTRDLAVAAMANERHASYCFSAVLGLYHGDDAEILEAERVLPDVVSHGSADLVEAFLQRVPQCDLDARNEKGHTALTEASRLGLLATTEVLIRRGADCNRPSLDFSGPRSPLQLASAAGSEAVMQLLLERGATLPDDAGGRGLLLYKAVERGQESLLKTLLRHGGNLRLLNLMYHSPLVLASGRGNEAIVRLLLDSGADCNQRDREGNTALMMAATKGHESVARALLERGADGHLRNEEDETPLLRAAELGHLAVVRLLLDRGVDVETRHSFGATPLSIARYMQHWDVARLLVERGADEKAARQAEKQYEADWRSAERRGGNSGSEEADSDES